MADKPKEMEVNGVKIKAEVSKDGKDIFVSMHFGDKIKSYQQINYLLHYYFALAEFKFVEKGKETIIQ